jgi:hypothetical protein
LPYAASHFNFYECVGVQPLFLSQEQAIDYAQGRACFRSGEIRILERNRRHRALTPKTLRRLYP